MPEMLPADCKKMSLSSIAATESVVFIQYGETHFI
jgi:hypothetical protein